ncbi:hypothetical protein CG747_26020 [Streptomyces sp. CB02959]|uniref:hypothetical protein n=1 Tax=Streptomyces sp. CB02959 TaxID=2020330 RepID=UPI000C27F398|nr:hypothetical protein [Streptomyces sp. CB02959]PJN37948.1 hypothetical protein CG747_26020 [Streptomyces sp. CB02959]
MTLTIAPRTIEDLITAHSVALSCLIDAPIAEQDCDFVDRVRVARDIFHACHLLHLTQGAAVVRDQFAYAENYLRYALWGGDHDATSLFSCCDIDVSRQLALALADGHLRRAITLCSSDADVSREVAQQAADGRLQRALERIF